MIDYSAMHDELEKIAAEKGKPNPYVTKAKLKQHLKVLGATAAGAGLGAGLGGIARRYAATRGAEHLKKLPKASVLKYAPYVAGALGAGSGLLWSRRNAQVRKMMDEADER